MTSSEPKVTYSCPTVTYSGPKAKMTFHNLLLPNPLFELHNSTLELQQSER